MSPTEAPRRLRRWQVRIERTAVAELTDDDWSELLGLYAQIYAITLADLQRTVGRRTLLHRVYERATGRLVGAAAYGAFRLEVPGRGRILVFSGGDLVLLPEARGLGLMQEMGLVGVLRETLRDPWLPRYLFVGAISYKLYRTLASTFRDYWPRYDRATPPEILEVLEQAGARVCGAAWRGASEPVPTGRWAHRGLLEVPEASLADPVIRFFVERNPTHLEGTVLPMLLPLDARNLVSVARKLVAQRRAPRA